MGSASEFASQLGSHHEILQPGRSSDRIPWDTYDVWCYSHVYTSPHTYFCAMQMSCFVQKIVMTLTTFCRKSTLSPGAESTTFASPNSRWHHSATGVMATWQVFQIFVICRGDWLSITFCENDSFRKLFLFFENTFQYLGGISQDISVSHFDSRRSLSSANQRQSTSESPIHLVSFTQPCDQHDRKIRTIRKSAARWRERRVRGYGKLILRANVLYVPNIKM